MTKQDYQIARKKALVGAWNDYLTVHEIDENGKAKRRALSNDNEPENDTLDPSVIRKIEDTTWPGKIDFVNKKDYQRRNLILKMK